mmetsp:Transcript_6440/g.28340  ORF Transcript_6440/g.28340 Transcript_6440/m.28340 type:complete len:280 (-) Transcript_6440:1672-2511(-)
MNPATSATSKPSAGSRPSSHHSARSVNLASSIDGRNEPFIHASPSSPSTSAEASASAAALPPPLARDPGRATSNPRGSKASASIPRRLSDSSTLTSARANASAVTFSAYAARSSRASRAPRRRGISLDTAPHTLPIVCLARRTALRASREAPSSPRSRKPFASSSEWKTSALALASMPNTAASPEACRTGTAARDMDVNRRGMSTVDPRHRAARYRQSFRYTQTAAGDGGADAAEFSGSRSARKRSSASRAAANTIDASPGAELSSPGAELSSPPPRPA